MAGFGINRVNLSGGLTFDPELRSLPSGTSVCKLRMAFNERIKNSATGEWEDRSNYIDLIVWAGMGEWCAKNLQKGSQIAIEGRLRWHDWQDKDTGKTRSAHEVIVDQIFAPKQGNGGGGQSSGFSARDESDFGAPTGNAGAGGFTPRQDTPVDTTPPPAGPVNPADDDIPF